MPVLPLLAFVLIIFFGKDCGQRFLYRNFAMALSFILSCLIFVKFVGGASSYEFNYPWFSFGGKVISAGILMNGLTAVMLVVVTLVSLLVQIYSVDICTMIFVIQDIIPIYRYLLFNAGFNSFK